MSLPLFFSLRYLKGKNKFPISLWSLLSCLGIFFGVFSILVSSAFMDGLKQVMMDSLLQSRAHITIKSKNNQKFEQVFIDELQKDEDIQVFSYVVRTQGVVRVGNKFQGLQIQGIDFAKHRKIVPYLNLLSPDKLSDNQIVIGNALSNRLSIADDTPIYFYSLQHTQNTAFGTLPSITKFHLSDKYICDDKVLEESLAYVNLSVAQRIAGKNSTKFLEIHLKNPYNAEVIAKALQTKLGADFTVTGWHQEDKTIYNSLKIESIALNLVLFLIVILAIFNMSGNFLRLVSEKSGEIGILKSMGLQQSQLKKIFVYCGLLIAGIGVGIGILSAYIFLNLQYNYHLIKIPIQGLGFDYLPVEISYLNGVYIFCAVMLSSLFFSYYPCQKLKKIDPIKVIKG